MPGGWKRYRNWVRESLVTLPPRLAYRVLCGPTNCGKTRLLQELARQGEQVLDLESLASHRGSLLGDLPGQPQPTQKTFDTRVLDVLRRFDPARPGVGRGREPEGRAPAGARGAHRRDAPRPALH